MVCGWVRMVSFPGRDGEQGAQRASVDGRISWLLSGRPAISKFGLSRGRDRKKEPDSVGEESVCFVSFLLFRRLRV